MIRYGRLRRRGTMSLHCSREMTIHRRCRYASMSRHRCCAIPRLSMSRENHCVAQADSAEAHCVGQADCNEADSAAQATNCPAVLWESQWADADPAEACCFHYQSCPAMHGQRGQQRKFQGLNRDQPLNCDRLSRGPSLNRGRRWKEISASHHFPDPCDVCPALRSDDCDIPELIWWSLFWWSFFLLTTVDSAGRASRVSRGFRAAIPHVATGTA